ncbi:DUF4870 family protein [Psychrobacter sp. 72-O-c]|uniref:DUF4870 family protein n=1 Tax=Psychrobacter sp. 72-O-c TaxID=2774125 RepID=UPI001D1026DE|nr:hypothetical protein [Psychrobacter sp. 72-O-c]
MNHSSDPKSPDLQSNERLYRQSQTADPTTDYEASFGGQYNHEQPNYEQTNHELTRQGKNGMMSDNKRRSLITYNHVTYLLYVVSYFTAGLLWIVPIVMNYAKRHDANGTWLATHFDWQIKTFWYSIVLFAIGALLIVFALGGLGVGIMADSGNITIGSFLFTGLGLLIMVFTFVWHLYRIIRGWIALTDGRPVP